MLAYRSAPWKASRARAAAVRLFDGEHGLARYPGPAFTLAADGRVLACNAAGRRLAEGFGAGLAVLARRAVESRNVASETLTENRADTASVIEAIALPLDGGAGALVLGRDVTLDHQIRTALTESRQRFKDLVEIGSDFAWETDAKGVFTYVSPRGALGHAASTLIDQPAHGFIFVDGTDNFAQPFTAREVVSDAEIWFSRVDGSPARLRVAALPLFDADGLWRGARGVCRDISREHAREAALAQASARERLLAFILRTVRDEADPRRLLSAAAEATARALDAGGAAIFRRDMDGDMTAAAVFGGTVPPALRSRLLAVLEAGGSGEVVEGELASHRAIAVATRYRGAQNGAILLIRGDGDGPWAPHEQVLLGEVAVQIGIANEQIRDHEALDRLSRRDALTGLLNRRAFDEALRGRVAQAGRNGRPGAVVYVDLDNFKVVNDTRGHSAGDAALKAVAAVLVDGSRSGDLVARLGGDEFALWLEETDPAGAEHKAATLLRAASRLVDYSGSPERPLGFSIGVAVSISVCRRSRRGPCSAVPMRRCTT
ncbi:MAG: diguanylate cyclase [Alphaproteobacteria bacterium]